MSSSLRTWSTPLALVALVAFLIFGTAWGWKHVTAPVVPKPPAPCVTQEMTVLESTSVTVRVYNGGGQTGLAGSTGALLRNRGFKVPVVDNTEEAVTTTIIVSANEDDPQALLVAGFFNGATIRADGRAQATVDVLVGSDFGGINENAPTSIEVPGGVVCLPSPTPTPTPTDEPTEGEPTDQPT